MKRCLVICIAVLCCLAYQVSAQDDAAYAARVNQYVAQYRGLAMKEQKRCGMPAAVILAQAILETEAGNSELVKGANNHFGIKCKSGWQGETFTHTDDIADECFRKYKTVAESYKDHSDYLKNTPRYAPLFKLSATDYAAWAYGLKQCGYATNPIYAQKLIGLIENYHLQEYTYAVMNGKSNIFKEAVAKSEKAKPDTIAHIVTPPVKTDTFAFKKIKKTIDIPPAKVKDTLTIAKINDTAAQHMAALVKRDTTYARAINNIPASQPILPKADSPAVKKDSVLKTAVVKTDTPGLVPANINSVAAANSLIEAPKQNIPTKTVKIHGLKAFYAHKGDMLLEPAMKYKIRYAKLLEMNDLPDAPLENDMYIYLEKKNAEGSHAYHTVLAGETLQQISQLECIQLKHLIAYNHLFPGEMPPPGTKLFLKEISSKRPVLAARNTPDTTTKPKHEDQYIIKQATEETPLPVVATAPEIPVTNNGEAQTNTPAADSEKKAADYKEAQQEKLAQLKSRLDKVVYAGDTTSNTAPDIEATQSAQIQAGGTETIQPAPVVKTISDSSKYYIVKDGDTIYNISHRFNITMRQLNVWNNLDSDSGIKKGMKLKIKE